MEKLLLIFAKNPELGKVKTRLAKDIGDEKALDVYQRLLIHTETVTKKIDVTKRVYYSNSIGKNDVWSETFYEKRMQVKGDLGLKMQIAFEESFSNGFKKVVIIGTDNPEIKQNHIEQAFKKLDDSDVVIGPAMDGGYYLLGLKQMIPALFLNKNWSTETVLSNSLQDLKNYNISFLPEMNDIDTLDDLKNSPLWEN